MLLRLPAYARECDLRCSGRRSSPARPPPPRGHTTSLEPTLGRSGKASPTGQWLFGISGYPARNSTKNARSEKGRPIPSITRPRRMAIGRPWPEGPGADESKPRRLVHESFRRPTRRKHNSRAPGSLADLFPTEMHKPPFHRATVRPSQTSKPPSAPGTYGCGSGAEHSRPGLPPIPNRGVNPGSISSKEVAHASSR